MVKFSKINLASLIIGFAFLYLPISLIVVFAFNESRLPGVWTGFSTQWFSSLMDNSSLLDAIASSLKIASMSATLAVILGTMAAISTTRKKPFHGQTLFGGLVSAPLVMPDIITGLALLLTFIAMERLIGWPANRGVITVTIAHTTMAMAYVYIVVRSRLKEFDKSLEEAALDLGAKPWAVLLYVVIPIISPALFSSWILAFLLSLEDVVISSFLSGPGSTTLPLVVFSNLKLGISPEINALSAVLVGFVAFGVIIMAVVNLKRSGKNK